MTVYRDDVIWTPEILSGVRFFNIDNTCGDVGDEVTGEMRPAGRNEVVSGSAGNGNRRG